MQKMIKAYRRILNNNKRREIQIAVPKTVSTTVKLKAPTEKSNSWRA
ncbi:hypothetical protein [Bartonella tribocorum]|nr:hypothetical protein [Bartonella tribocorum]